MTPIAGRRRPGHPGARLADTLDRAGAYVEAGTDGIFVPGVTDVETIAALAKEIAVLLNVMAGPGSPSVGELGSVGAVSLFRLWAHQDLPPTGRLW